MAPKGPSKQTPVEHKHANQTAAKAAQTGTIMRSTASKRELPHSPPQDLVSRTRLSFHVPLAAQEGALLPSLSLRQGRACNLPLCGGATLAWSGRWACLQGLHPPLDQQAHTYTGHFQWSPLPTSCFTTHALAVHTFDFDLIHDAALHFQDVSGQLAETSVASPASSVEGLGCSLFSLC